MAQIDIIMPLYNKAATVERAVRSILNQRLTDWRLIVVDDGSTDDGPQIVQDFRDSRIELIRQTNCGPGAARNAGLARSKGEFVAFLDADDEWLTDYLHNAVQAMRANNDVGLVGTMYRESPPWRNIPRLYARRGVREGVYQLRGDESPRRTGWLVPFFSCWNSLIRGDSARRYGGFYDKARCLYGEDAPFFLRILFNEKFMIIGPQGVIYHRDASALSLSGRAHPPLPFLDHPELVLTWCPEEKKLLMRKVLDYYALRTIREWTRYGLRDQARELFGRYPGIRTFGPEYYRFRYELLLSRWFPHWVRFKCAVGPPARLIAAKFTKSIFSGRGKGK
jgi:glycosyltransferase involved in cell wall biosynthesis